MGAGGSVAAVPNVPESTMDIDVPTFKKLRKLYEEKKNDMGDEELLTYLKQQHNMLFQVMGASGGAIEFPEGMVVGGKRGSQRQSTFLQEHGGSFARKSKLSIIQGELTGTETRMSFNQSSLAVQPENQIARPRKPSLTSTDEQYVTPKNIDSDKAERNRVSFDPETDFDENKEGEETEADAEERKSKVRARQATGYVKNPPPADDEDVHVTFGEEEGEETEADAEERKKKVRARQATGFVKKPAGVSFGDDDEESKEGEETEADAEERKSKLRNRQPTGFVKKE